jgi:hypothetical protein
LNQRSSEHDRRVRRFVPLQRFTRQTVQFLEFDRFQAGRHLAAELFQRIPPLICQSLFSEFRVLPRQAYGECNQDEGRDEDGCQEKDDLTLTPGICRFHRAAF